MQGAKYVRIISSGRHVIDIDHKYLLIANDTQLTFQFDFNWRSHAESCNDCQVLLSTLIPVRPGDEVCVLTWYAFLDGKFKLIDFFRFGDSNDETQGYLFISSRSHNFVEEGKYANPNDPLDITRLRLTLLPLEPGALEPEKLISEYYGNTRRCNYLNMAQRQN